MNRYWQMHFGSGLVTTAEDFGGRRPQHTHPELLDWLATDFINSGWDTKATLKKMVLSATYRQDSKLRPELLEKDPENLLLARGPSQRLPAEMIAIPRSPPVVCGSTGWSTGQSVFAG